MSVRRTELTWHKISNNPIGSTIFFAAWHMCELDSILEELELHLDRH